MTLGVAISFILWILTITGFVIWNLYKKNKQMEELIEAQNYYIQIINSMSGDLESVVNKIDTTMWVQSDPELIQLFETIKNIQQIIKRTSNTNGN